MVAEPDTNIWEGLFQGLNQHEIEKIFFDELGNPELNQHGKNLLTAYLCAERVL